MPLAKPHKASRSIDEWGTLRGNAIGLMDLRFSGPVRTSNHTAVLEKKYPQEKDKVLLPIPINMSKYNTDGMRKIHFLQMCIHCFLVYWRIVGKEDEGHNGKNTFLINHIKDMTCFCLLRY